MPQWVPVDANGNPVSDWSFRGTPTGSATSTYPSKWQVLGQPSYPFSPNISNSPDFYGDGPFPVSSGLNLDARAQNYFFYYPFGNLFISDTGSVTVNAQGDYTLNLAWKPIWEGPPPAPAAPPAPYNVNLLITVNGGGGASVQANPGYSGTFPSNATASSTISDSLGDGGSYSVGTTGSQGPYRHLVQIQGSNTVTKSIHMTGTAMASNPDGTSVNYMTIAEGSASLSAVASLDNRIAVLSRNGQDKIDPDGTHHGDTIFSYSDFLPSAGRGIPPTVINTLNNQSLSALRSQGAWSPDATLGYTWSPSNSADTLNSGVVQMGYGNISYLNGEAQGKHDTPTTYHVTYTCTDPKDGATATANYDFMVHDQWDNWTSDPVTPTTSNDRYDYLSVAGAKTGVENPAGSTGPVKGHWTFTITVGFSLGTSLSSSFKLSDAATFGISFTPTVSASFGASLGVDSPNIDPGYESFPYVHTHWLTDHYLVDNYSPGGQVAGPVNGHFPQAIDDHSTLTSTVGWSPETKIGQPT